AAGERTPTASGERAGPSWRRPADFAQKGAPPVGTGRPLVARKAAKEEPRSTPPRGKTLRTVSGSPSRVNRRPVALPRETRRALTEPWRRKPRRATRRSRRVWRPRRRSGPPHGSAPDRSSTPRRAKRKGLPLWHLEDL